MTQHEFLKNEILTTFGGSPSWRIWPNNTGTAYRGRRRISFGKKGSADIIGLMSNGVFVGIEIKVGRDKQSADQLAFESVIKKYRGFYIVARSLDDVARFLAEYEQK